MDKITSAGPFQNKVLHDSKKNEKREKAQLKKEAVCMENYLKALLFMVR